MSSDSPVRTLTAAAGAVSATSGTLMGGCVKVSAAATVDLYDSASAAGKLLFSFTVAGAGAACIPINELGVRYDTGLFIATSAGTVTGSLWVVQ